MDVTASAVAEHSNRVDRGVLHVMSLFVLPKMSLCAQNALLMQCMTIYAVVPEKQSWCQLLTMRTAVNFVHTITVDPKLAVVDWCLMGLQEEATENKNLAVQNLAATSFVPTTCQSYVSHAFEVFTCRENEALLCRPRQVVKQRQHACEESEDLSSRTAKLAGIQSKCLSALLASVVRWLS